MDNEEKRLRVEYLIAHKNNLWMGVVVLTGGLVGILITMNYSTFVISLQTIVKTLLLALGAFFLVSMIIGLINIHKEVDNIIRNKGDYYG